MSTDDHDEEERAKRGAFWSRLAMTLLSLRTSLDSQRLDLQDEASREPAAGHKAPGTGASLRDTDPDGDEGASSTPDPPR